MRTFIFLKNYRKGNKVKRVIVGFVQSEQFPSSLVNCSGSIFHGCDCKEITEQCHVEVGEYSGI